MSEKFAMDGYVDVAERIRLFKDKHPEGSLRPVNPDEPVKVMVVGDKTFLQYVAAAYRSPDDTCPGIGVAWELFPGKTPYTRDSEAMNAESSAWGRAIVATLAADTKRGVASANEVRNAQANQDAPAADPGSLRKLIAEEGQRLGWVLNDVTEDYAQTHGGEHITGATVADLTAYLAKLRKLPTAETLPV